MGDVITAIDGRTIASLEDLTAAKKGYAAGDTTAVTVFRGGEDIELQLTFGTLPDNQDNQHDATTSATQDQTGGYPGDLFDYFFGSRPGSGTAA